jgi:hypothetical protein
MIRKISLLLLTWAVTSVAAQDIEKPVEYLLFKGTNNAGNDLISPQAGIMTAEECVNLDLSDSTLKLRWGSISTYKHASIDTLRGLFALTNNDGESRLFAYGHFTAKQYDEMVWSPIFSQGFGTGGTKYLYMNETPHWAVWDDILVATNSKNRPWRFDGTQWGQLVPTAPGSPDYAPSHYNTDIYFLHGDYYYAIQPHLPCSTISGENVWGLLGNLSWRIHVDSGTIPVFYYPETGVTGSCADPDSTIFRLCRTRADREKTDSFFIVATIEKVNPVVSTSSIWDSIADDSLGNVDYPFAGFLDTLVREADSAEDTTYRIGQPTWIETEILAAGGAGIGAQMDTALITHHRYGVCFYDSITGALSPMSPVLRVPTDEGAAATIEDTLIKIALPNITKSEPHLWRVIFRAREWEDTVRVPDSVWEPQQIEPNYDPGTGEYSCPYGWYIVNLPMVGKKCRKMGWTYFARTTKRPQIGGYYPLDVIKSAADTFYSDTLSYVALEARTTPFVDIGMNVGPYGGVILPTQFHYPTIYKNRLFMASGSNVYYTEPGNIGVIDLYFPINLDDGDEITGFYVSGGELLIFKNRSIHKAVWIGEGFSAEEYIPGIGCIAPGSIIDMPGGGYGFLSEHGYYVFTTHLQSLYKESGGNLPNISKPIWENLSAYDIADLRECHAWWSPTWEALHLSFPTLDTTWAYFTNGCDTTRPTVPI